MKKTDYKLSREQMEHLREIKFLVDDVCSVFNEDYLTLTATEIAEILPKYIDDYDYKVRFKLEIWVDQLKDSEEWVWFVGYIPDCDDAEFELECVYNTEMIDALYEMLCICIEKNYVNAIYL